MRAPIWQVDAFASAPFAGNPAAVCRLDAWPEDALLQHVAAEMNLSETAFLVPEAGGWRLRWFTPRVEVDLCGHATLACAHVLFATGAAPGPEVRFATRSGPIGVRRVEDALELDLPARPPRPGVPPPALLEALGPAPLEVHASARDWLAVYGREATVRDLAPDLARLRALGPLGVIVTAPGDEVDLVSRFFAPGVGVDEDPVTGSAHCVLVPYWAARLGRGRLRARQLSARGGELVGEARGDRVALRGHAVTVVEGTLVLEGR